MNFAPFKLERYFAEHEFSAPYLLSASDCESLTLPELLALAGPDDLARWAQLSLGYTESQGLPALRAAIAELYPPLTPAQVMVAVPEEAIFIAMHTLLQAGDDVVAVAPAYQSLHEVARGLGCTVIPWALQATPTGWHADVDDLARLITPRTRLLVLNFPHNPTGHLLSMAELHAVVALARRHGLPIFADEMYRWLEADPADTLPTMCTLYEAGISLSGVSKSLNAPGLRVGWLATSATALIQKWLTFKDYTTICHSAPSEVLALMTVKARETLVARNRILIAHHAALMAQFCAARPHLFTWRAPRAGSVALAQWHGAQPVEAWCEDLIHRAGVMVVPGNMFDWPGGYFRVGLGRANFPRALKQLAQALG